MKLITNSIIVEEFQTSISHAELDLEMASCDIAKVNGQCSKDQVSSENIGVKKVTRETKLSNGINSKIASAKCNGKVNGFYDETSDDDYQLVLETSSEEELSKKIDEDTISAPQIVQEIEDLLGIKSITDGIEEEKDLVLDSTESADLTEEEGFIDNDESVSNSAEEVFIDNHETECQSKDKESSKEEKESELSDKISDAECDASSSNMNLVFDEVEIGDDNEESEITTEKTNEAREEKLVEKDTNSHSIETNETGKIINTENESKTNYNNVHSKKVENKNDTEDKVASATEEEVLTLSQTSNVSDCSTEWVVLDSVGSSEDEANYHPKSSIVNTEKNSEEGTLSNSTVYSKSHIENDAASNSSIVSPDEGPRKRALSIEEENFKFKKPKLEVEELTSCDTQCSKRQRAGMIEEDVKRIKVCNSADSKGISDKKTDKSDIEMCVETSEKHGNKLNTNESVEIKPDVEVGKEISGDKVTIDKTSERAVVSSNTDDSDADDSKSKLRNEVDKMQEDCNCKDEELDSNKFVGVESSCKTEEIDLNKSLEIENKHENKELNYNEILEEENKCKYAVLQSNELDSHIQDCTETNITRSEITNKPEKDEIELNNVIDTKPVSSLLSKTLESISSEVTSSDEVCKNVLSSENECSEDKNSIENSIKKSQFDNESKEDVGVSSTMKSADIEVETKSISLLDNKSSENSLKEDVSSNKLDNVLNVNDDIEMVDASENNESSPKMDVDESFVVKNDEKSTTKNETKVEKTEKNSNQENGLRSPFTVLSKANPEKDSEPKQQSNLDKSIESVVEKARSETSRLRPLLKKFHKDQLKKMTRPELEEAVVLKICEAVTDRSEIGQLRLRCQTLEQNNDLWRKKAAQFEKQNRELEMVLKRFLAETAQLKRDNQNKMALPIKVTRSVGLQVVLASSMHGALVSSKNRLSSDSSPSTSNRSSQQQTQNQQQPISKPKHVEKDAPREPMKAFVTPAHSSTASTVKRGRPLKQNAVHRSTSSSAQATPIKATPPTTPVKTLTPAKTITAPGKDLEVIDLTDRDERSKPSQKTSPTTVGGSIRVNPSTQLCFVQTSSPATTTAPMAYLVQKAGQRQQYLVTASSSPSTTRPPVASNSRPAAVALPVFRSQIIPVQANSQVAVRAPMVRQVPQTIRLQQTQVMLKHPAPLPAAPIQSSKPNYKMPPPKPQLKIAKTNNGIMLSWSMSLTKEVSDMASYQLYAYQEGSQPPSTSLWKKVGDVKALPLPMACTLTQFIEGHKYHFAVRAVDIHGRIGPFSQPSSILLSK